MEAQRRLPPQGPRIDSDVCALHAQASVSAGAYADAVAAYVRAAELARADFGYPGMAAMFLAFSVSSALLGGGDIEQATATAEESVALARQAGMPVAIVLSLNALALTLVERNPTRARTVLQDSIERSSTPAEEISPAFGTAALVAARLRDWDLSLALAARSMHLYRWSMPMLAAATNLAECARAFAEDRPEIAGVLQGASSAAFRRANPSTNRTGQSPTVSGDPSANWVLAALRETGGSSVPRWAISADASFAPKARR